MGRGKFTGKFVGFNHTKNHYGAALLTRARDIVGKIGSNKENARGPPSHIFREGGKGKGGKYF